MNDESTLKLAISMHANPGVYALLVGSGVSRAAGILTGWDIVLDLTRKVAAIGGEEPQQDLETWYQQKFGEPPDYDKVLDKLTQTSAERMALLRPYFEPTEEEREQKLKIPTAAHKAIATLAKLGYIRMILTTNFDRLIELALEEEGIVPDVISSNDDLKGVIPYVHSRCYIVKVHGDYHDVRMKNITTELAPYSKVLNKFLDRVFDEFGRIICGWSGEWDQALRSAILRCPNRRFATYWLARGGMTDEAKRLIDHRRAEVIYIEGADQFFTNLSEKVESLRELERSYPISVKVAVQAVKRYLTEPRHQIRLRDLIHDETERVYQEFASEKFSVGSPSPTKGVFQQRLHQYEAVTEKLMAMVATLSFYDAGGNAELLKRVIERLTRFPQMAGSSYHLWDNLRYYPALLVVYTSGICFLATKHFQNLAITLL